MSREALEFLLTRRSRPREAAGPPAPGRDEILRLLTAAVRVPDHGKLEPWRFVVLEGAGLVRFAAAIRARAAETGAGRRQGGAGLRAGADGGRGGGLAEAERQDPGDRADAVGRVRGAQPAQRRAGGGVGGELADRLGGL